ncbi:sensor histidine kinase [Paucibacter sp. JuS9]|uniref:sensor histidine kinase n=1 Tax=Paucibacter sp. JuS9 TaxID=3228748 RepID=UPI00375786F6
MSIRQVLENTRLEAEVARRTAQLTELARHMQTVREDERARLARDLHDELGALLTSARLDAARIRARLGDTAPEALERLAHLVQTLDTVVALKRRIIEDLRPSALAHLGLPITLDILAREFGEQSGLQIHCDLMATQLVPAAELTMYRLVQEALNNVAKHAGARQVWIKLQALAGEPVHLSVRDDGCGFLPCAASSASHGLAGMRFRVEAEGGSLEIHSAPGQGTQISASLPLA